LVEGLNELFTRLEAQAPAVEVLPWIEADPNSKRRRIQCVSRPEASLACAS
jgi:hypothetical protein